MTLTPVQTITNAQSFVVSITATITPTVGNTYVATACINEVGTHTSITFSDNKGNTWNTIDSGSPAAGMVAAGGYALNVASGSTIVTATADGVGNTGSMSIIVREYLVADLTSFDQHTAQNGSSTNPTSGATVNTTQVFESVIGWTYGFVSTGGTVTAGAGFGNFSQAIGLNSVSSIEDMSVSSIGSQTANFNNSTSSTYRCGVMTFKTNNTGGGFIPRKTLIGVGI